MLEFSDQHPDVKALTIKIDETIQNMLEQLEAEQNTLRRKREGLKANLGEMKERIAAHLGWADLHADTRPFGPYEWKFNIWKLVEPWAREIQTRSVNPLIEMPRWNWRQARRRLRAA